MFTVGRLVRIKEVVWCKVVRETRFNNAFYYFWQKREAGDWSVIRFRLRTPAFIFCLPWGRPCGNHAKRCINEKTIQCLPNPSQHVSIYLQKFPSYTMLKSMLKSKNRYFYHIFVSPGYAPGTITLNVVWMERECDAYKLPRCMCPSHYIRFWDRAWYLWTNCHFVIPPCIRRPC